MVVAGMPRSMPEEPRESAESVLSARELEVLPLTARGLSNRQISRSLHLSEATVERHLVNIYPKIGVASRGEEGAGRELDHHGGRHRVAGALVGTPGYRPPHLGTSARASSRAASNPFMVASCTPETRPPKEILASMLPP